MSNTPALRFPGFVGEWEEKSIKETSSLIKDGSHGSHKDAPSSNYILLSAKNIKNGNINIYDDDRRITEQDYNSIYKNYYLKNGDIVLTIVGTIGRVAVVNNLKNAAFQRSVAFFRFDAFNSSFIYNLFNTKKFQNELDRRKVISAQPGIYLGDLSKIKLTLPSLPEQQKIASFLSAVDAKISQITQKGVLLGEYKRGVMQGIFSQEIRFLADDGSVFGDWVERRLGEVAKFQQGVQVDVELQIKNPKVNYIKFIRIENYTQLSNDFRYIPQELSNNKTINDSEIAIVRYGATAGFIGRGFSGILANNLFKVLPNKKFLDTEYLFHYLNSYKVFSFFQSEMSGGAMPALSFGIAGALKIPFPSLPEQTKIANFLSAIDTKIEENTQSLKKMKTFKRGLLQGMFA